MISQELWYEYKTTKNPEIRDNIFNCYSKYAEGIALINFKKHPQYLDIQDFISYAYIGLLNAIEKYDITKNISFKTYAYKRIKGSIIDELRRESSHSRSLLERYRKIERAKISLIDSGIIEPTDENIAKRAKLSLKVYNKCRYLYNLMIAPMQFESADWVLAPENQSPIRMFEHREIEKFLLIIRKRLSKREINILVLYYYEGWKMNEIARLYGLTNSRIQQILQDILDRLRIYIQRRRLYDF